MSFKLVVSVESLYGGQFTLSTQLIKPNYLVSDINVRGLRSVGIYHEKSRWNCYKFQKYVGCCLFFTALNCTLDLSNFYKETSCLQAWTICKLLHVTSGIFLNTEYTHKFQATRLSWYLVSYNRCDVTKFSLCECQFCNPFWKNW